MIYLFLAAAIAGIDLYVKNRIEQTESFQEHTICKNKLRIRKHHNTGAAFNILSGKRKLVTGASLGLTLAVIVRMCSEIMRKGRMGIKLALACIAGGGISNTYDRCSRNYVVDYVSMENMPEFIKRIVFNIGDFFVFFGSIFFVVFRRKKIKKSSGN